MYVFIAHRLKVKLVNYYKSVFDMPIRLPRLLKRNKKHKKTTIGNNKMGCTQSKSTSGAVCTTSDGLSKGKFVL